MWRYTYRVEGNIMKQLWDFQTEKNDWDQWSILKQKALLLVGESRFASHQGAQYVWSSCHQSRPPLNLMDYTSCQVCPLTLNTSDEFKEHIVVKEHIIVIRYLHLASVRQTLCKNWPSSRKLNQWSGEPKKMICRLTLPIRESMAPKNDARISNLLV